MSNAAPTIKVTPALIGFALSFLALATYGWNAVGYFKAIETKNVEQDMRLDRTDRDRTRNTESMNKLADKTDELKEAVIKLTTVIDERSAVKKTSAPDHFDPLTTEDLLVDIKAKESIQ